MKKAKYEKNQTKNSLSFSSPQTSLTATEVHLPSPLFPRFPPFQGGLKLALLVNQIPNGLLRHLPLVSPLLVFYLRLGLASSVKPALLGVVVNNKAID